MTSPRAEPESRGPSCRGTVYAAGKQSEGNQLRSTEIRKKSLKSSTENVPYRLPSMPMVLSLLFSCSNPPFYPTIAGGILKKKAARPAYKRSDEKSAHLSLYPQ